MDKIRELRLLLDLEGDLRSVCKLSFSNRDASIYLFPYAPTGRYYYGGRSMEEIEFEDTFRFVDDKFTERVPKLSIHESGQIHIKSDGIIAGPLLIHPLSEWRGEHILSVSVDEFNILSRYSGMVSTSGKRQDCVIKTPSKAKSGRFIFCLAGDRPAFVNPRSLVISMMRTTIKCPIFIGVQPKIQKPLGEPKGQGITVIAGWDRKPVKEKGVDYLYIRGV